MKKQKLTIQERIKKIQKNLKTVYKITADIVKELNLIESEKAWMELEGFETVTFKYFLETNFDLSFTAFQQMKKLLDGYGKQTFNEFGYKTLSAVNKTDDPYKTLDEIKELKRSGQTISMSKLKDICNENRLNFKDNRGRPKKSKNALNKDDVFDAHEWLEEQLKMWVDKNIIMEIQVTPILELYKENMKKVA